MPTQDNVLIQHKPGVSSSHVVVFVHGFTGSSQGTWGKFPELLRVDSDLSNFDIFLWGYPSAILGNNPDVRLLGDQLKTEVNERLKNYKYIYLVGHSLGGVVIQSMVIEQLKAGQAAALNRIQHIVLFGTPSQGVQLPAILGMINRQLYDIRITSDTVEELRREWINRVYAPTIRPGDENYKRHIPVTTVVGLQDELVPESSVRSFYQDPPSLTVPGNHSTMKEPADNQATAYILVKNRLLNTFILPAPQVLSGMIHVYERNGAFWGGHPDNNPIPLGPNVIFHKNEMEVARITPVVKNDTSDEVISVQMIVLTIHFGTAKPEFTEPTTLWRPMTNATTYRSFVTEWQATIPPGRILNGPNESILVKFPKGQYKVEYIVQGMSEKKVPFNVEGHYFVEVP